MPGTTPHPEPCFQGFSNSTRLIRPRPTGAAERALCWASNTEILQNWSLSSSSAPFSSWDLGPLLLPPVLVTSVKWEGWTLQNMPGLLYCWPGTGLLHPNCTWDVFLKYRFLGSTHVPDSNSLDPKHLNSSFKYLLRTYYVPGTEDTAVSKTERNPCSRRGYLWKQTYIGKPVKYMVCQISVMEQNRAGKGTQDRDRFWF